MAENIWENGPGDPEIGPILEVRFPDDVVASLDAVGRATGRSRADVVRSAVRAYLRGVAGNPVSTR